jgi:DHA1 family bicyclomycin/chloramphenicol resistance-like MFS transporter
MTSPRFLAVCLGATFCFAGLFLYVAAAPTFLMQHLGVSSTGFLWLFGPLTAGLALGAWISGRIAGRMTATRTLAWAFAFMGAAAGGNFWWHSVHAPALPWSVAPLFFYSFGMALAFPTLTLLALDLFPEKRGLAASCQSFIQTGGGAVVALLAPFVWSTPRLLAATQLAMVVIALAVLLAYRKIPAENPADHGLAA